MMQAIDGQRTVWFKYWRSTKSGNSTGNEFEGCPNEEGIRTLAYLNFTPAIQWSMYKYQMLEPWWSYSFLQEHVLTNQIKELNQKVFQKKMAELLPFHV